MFAPKGSAFAPTPKVLPIINSDVGSTSRRGVWGLFSVIGCGVVQGGGILRSADQAVAHAEGDGMSAVIRAESSEQSAGVCFHGVHGQEQVTTDFPVGLSAAAHRNLARPTHRTRTAGPARNQPRTDQPGNRS